MKKFYRLSIYERDRIVKEKYNLDSNELNNFKTNINEIIGDNLIENFIGYFNLPTGLCFNLKINNKNYTVPMVVEETSIIAALNSAVKLVNEKGEITTSFPKRHIVGQIYFHNLKKTNDLIKYIEKNKVSLMNDINHKFYSMKQRGGGVKNIKTYTFTDNTDTFLRIHIICDPCEAMGANYINQVCEYFAKVLENKVEKEAILKILSNYSKESIIKSRVSITGLDEQFAKKIVIANKIAKHDIYRAVTHNKGIMNGIDSVLISTGNDWRAVEASCHAYASRNGKYEALTNWDYIDGKLIGEIELPILIGSKGGVIDIHPQVKTNLKILNVNNVHELTQICASIGLLQNYAALKTLVSDGIVKGHMNLHINNIALSTGASGKELNDLIIKLKKYLKEKNKVTQKIAREFYENR
jgi:hydroxymethylglutaryl-CoA reductase